MDRYLIDLFKKRYLIYHRGSLTFKLNKKQYNDLIEYLLKSRLSLSYYIGHEDIRSLIDTVTNYMYPNVDELIFVNNDPNTYGKDISDIIITLNMSDTYHIRDISIIGFAMKPADIPEIICGFSKLWSINFYKCPGITLNDLKKCDDTLFEIKYYLQFIRNNACVIGIPNNNIHYICNRL